jgi:hypothetical protein
MNNMGPLRCVDGAPLPLIQINTRSVHGMTLTMLASHRQSDTFNALSHCSFILGEHPIVYLHFGKCLGGIKPC